MKKSFLLIALMAGLSLTVHAQAENAAKQMSIGAELGLPLVKAANNQVALGGSVQFEFPTTVSSFNFTLSAGYINFPSANGSSFIPVKAGGKYYFGSNFYAAGEIGGAFSTESGGSTAFAFAPGLGTSFPAADKSRLDIGLRLETWVSGGASSFMGLRAAYAFSL